MRHATLESAAARGKFRKLSHGASRGIFTQGREAAGISSSTVVPSATVDGPRTGARRMKETQSGNTRPDGPDMLLEQHVRSLSDVDLLRTRSIVDSEMRSRGLAMSVGEIGEMLAIEYFNSTRGLPNLQKAPPGTKNVDALSRAGERYSIKTVCRGKKTGTVYPDPSDMNTRGPGQRRSRRPCRRCPCR